MKTTDAMSNTEVTDNDKVAMRHFFALWGEFNRTLDLTLTAQPTPLRERVHLFAIYARSWGKK